MTDHPRGWERHVIVVGLDGVGLRSVELLKDAGVRVVVIDPKASARLQQAIDHWGIPLLSGSPRLPKTLQEAGIEGAQAVLCVESSDAAGLETALLARELRPDLRVVLRLSNVSVGSAVGDLGITVLDTAGLAAPAIVETCLQAREHAVTIAGKQFLAASQPAPRAGTLRELYGSLAPVAVVPAGDEPLLCPGRDLHVNEGDEVLVVGLLDELVEAGIRQPPGAKSERIRVWTGRRYVTVRQRTAPHLVRTRRFLRTAFSTVRSVANRSVRVCLGLQFVLLVTSSLVLRLNYVTDTGGHLSIIESAYFTVETVATVGFGDFNYSAQSNGLEIFGVLLIITGTSLVTTTFAMLTNSLVSRGVEQSLGISQATTMRGHVVVVGLGAVGVRVLDLLLAAGQQVVVLESDPNNRHLGQARARKVPVVIGDATLASTLSSVQLHHAAAVAVLTSNDLVNVETGLAVRQELGDRWIATPVVLRIFDRQLARTVEQSFGFTHVRSTSAVTSPFFVGAALGLEFIGAFAVAKEQLLVGRLGVTPGGGLDGLAMLDLSARTRVLAIQRASGQLEHPPRRDTRFAGGDIAYLIGPYTDLLTLLRRDNPA